MKCEECKNIIEEYCDGELDERASIDVRAHVMNCEACARLVEALGDEQNVYALYVRDVEVSPMLWKGISARILEEERARDVSLMARWRRQLAEIFGTPRLSPALTFALLILTMGTTAGLMKLMQSRSAEPVTQKQPESSTTAPPKVNEQTAAVTDGKENDPVENDGAIENDTEQFTRPSDKNVDRLPPAYRIADRFESKRAVATVGFTDEQSPDQLVREAEQKYRAAIALLARDAKRRRTLLEPDMRARFEQTLAAVDQTINETRRAARQHPDDPVAVQFMLAAYAKKVDVLREMAASRVDNRDIQ
jgi:hypothetical protein